MVEDRFSLEIAERLIEESNLDSRGIYTSVGTYDYQEIVRSSGGRSPQDPQQIIPGHESGIGARL